MGHFPGSFLKQMKAVIATGALLSTGLLLSQITPAQAATFTWSFSNVIGGIDGSVSGILELPEGENVAATSVVFKTTTNPVFDSLVGLDFTTLPNFANEFKVNGGEITAAQFATDFFSNTTNLNLELNTEEFGDPDSQNQALLTLAGNPFDVCPDDCLETAPIFGDNTGETEFAPTFTAVPEASPVAGLLVTFGLIGVNQLRKTTRRLHS
ncbi:MAG: hypothetical protein F6K26_44220 [Moorea sp. SIO2I5]|nr:hypothetical protein [Moorena sp. SIO2I5]